MLMAGVTMNFLLAAILFSVGFIVGLPADISNLNDDKIIVVDQPQVIVQMVEKESPAENKSNIFTLSLASISINFKIPPTFANRWFESLCH